jgi:hypothetical protein
MKPSKVHVPKPTADSSRDDLSQVLAKRIGLEEFLIDFFAGLVPGMAFLAGAVVSLLGPLITLGVALRTQILHEIAVPKTLFESLASMLSATKDTPTAFWIAVLVVGTLLAYVTGLFIYRMDPDHPDRQSYRRLKRTLAEKNDSKPPEYRLVCQDEVNCRYPYPEMGKYLSDRGLTHLMPFVASDNPDEARVVTKSHLMIIKTRLRFLFPERASSLIRIESHIRLNSSMWYVAHYLERISWAAVAVTACAAILPCITIAGASGDWRDSVRYSFSVVYPLLIYSLAHFCRIAVERSLHYMRVRELVHLYEASYVAFRDQFWHLCPPYKMSDFSSRES